MIEQTTKTG